MATYLYRLGGWAFEHRRTVLVGWLVVLGLVIASAAAFSGQTTNKFSVPGTESQRAQDLLHEKFAGAGGASARVVFAAPRGERLTDPDNRAAVMASVTKAEKAEDVSFVIDPFSVRALSADKRIGFADGSTPLRLTSLRSHFSRRLSAGVVAKRRVGGPSRSPERLRLASQPHSPWLSLLPAGKPPDTLSSATTGTVEATAI